MGEPAILGTKLEREIKDTVLMTGDMTGGKIMPGTIRAAMWTNGAMLLVTAIPTALTLRAVIRAQVVKKATVLGWEAMVEKLRALIPLRLLELVRKAEDANRDEEALYGLMEDISPGVEATGDGVKRAWRVGSSSYGLQWHQMEYETEAVEQGLRTMENGYGFESLD